MKTKMSQISSGPGETLQTRSSNTLTNLVVAPAGTGVGSATYMCAGSDIANTSRAFISIDGVSANVISDAVGTGTALPLTFVVGGAERMRLLTNGNIVVGANADIGTGKFQVQANSGQYGIYSLGFNGAGVSNGIYINAGTNTNDYSFVVGNRSGSIGIFNARGDGATIFNSTGSNINANIILVNGGQNNYCINCLGSGSAASYGIYIQAGLTNSDAALSVSGRGGSYSLLSVSGTGSINVNANQANVAPATQALNVYGYQQAYSLYVYGYPSSSSGYSYGVQIASGYFANATSSLILYTRDMAWITAQFVSNGAASINSSSANNGQNTLNVYGQANAYTQQISGYNSTGNSFGLYITAGLNSSDSGLYVLNRSANSSQLQVYGMGSVNFNASQISYGNVNVVTIYGSASYAALFVVSYNSGNASGAMFQAGVNSADYTLGCQPRNAAYNGFQVRGDGYLGSGGGLQVNGYYQGGTFFGVNAPNVANASGQLIAQSHPVWSSKNFKTEIRSIAEDGGRSALDLVNAIRGVRYQHHSARERLVDPTKGAAGYEVDHTYTPDVGFLAEEVVSELPEVISRYHDMVMGMDYGKMVPVLWEAVKELSAQVQALQAAKPA